MKVHYNGVDNSYSCPTAEDCLSWCLTHPTCVALEYRPGDSTHCALDHVGRFEAEGDWVPGNEFNYYDFYLATRGLYILHVDVVAGR